MKIYGTPDADDTATLALMAFVASNAPHLTPTYLLHHQRVPIDARPCKRPGSLLVQMVMDNGRVISALQNMNDKHISFSES